MVVRWSVLAADDLERICDWIERDNPEAADELRERFTMAAVSSLRYRKWAERAAA